VRLVHRGERADLDDPGVVHEHVDAAEVRLRLGDQALGGVLVGEVAGHGVHLGARVVQLPCRLIQRRGVAGADQQARTAVGQLAGDGETQAARGSGDQRRGALESVHDPPSGSVGCGSISQRGMAAAMARYSSLLTLTASQGVPFDASSTPGTTYTAPVRWSPTQVVTSSVCRLGRGTSSQTNPSGTTSSGPTAMTETTASCNSGVCISPSCVLSSIARVARSSPARVTVRGAGMRGFDRSPG